MSIVWYRKATIIIQKYTTNVVNGIVFRIVSVVCIFCFSNIIFLWLHHIGRCVSFCTMSKQKEYLMPHSQNILPFFTYFVMNFVCYCTCWVRHNCVHVPYKLKNMKNKSVHYVILPASTSRRRIITEGRTKSIVPLT